MKTIINNIILFITITVIALLSGYFIYQSYMTYKGYQIAQGADKYISYIKNTNEILKFIEQECASSALYLGKKGKIDFSQIQTSRDKTDSAIKNANQFITENPKFLSNLQYVRSRVDVISSDYKDILFTYYQDEISNSLLKEMKNTTAKLSLGLSSLKKELYAYSDFSEYRNSIAKEKSFITYILTLSKKMSKQDLLLWEGILANLQLQNLSKFDQSMRLGIARGITTGNYQISTKQWFENTDQRIAKVIKSEEKIYKYIQSQITNETLYPKALIYNVAISIFLLLSLFSLLRLQKGKSKKRVINKDIVRKKEIYDNDTKEIIRKKRMTDISKSNTLFDGLQNQNIRNRATDIPLTNSIHVDKSILQENKTPLVVFNPIEDFAHIINHFTKILGKKNIGFKYQIDSAIPTYCIGNIDKINEAFEYFLDYIIKSSNSNNFITLSIDNIAQTKLESAIRFSIKQNKTHFTQEEIKEIENGRYTNPYKDKARIVKLNKAKENLLKVSKLVSTIDGSFKIKSDSKKETDFFITINLRRE